MLHPPLLEEAGLVSALEWFVDGFSQRSEIQTEFDVAPDLGRLPAEFEITVSRIVQECLTNVHRHSGSPKARVRVHRSGSELCVEVTDWGKGMPEPVAQGHSGASGVGLGGIRERVRQLQGTLQIRSGADGTTVIALLPVPVSELASR